MKKLTILTIILFISLATDCQSLYIKTFGSPDSHPIIFLHGGPGYNCANFESTTAKRLSENGFYVIVYDRRGEGRSPDANASFTFKETNSDLESIYKQFNLKKASLIGHSFGGVVAVNFADTHIGLVKNIYLVGAPVSLQETFKTIINSSKKIYSEKKDSLNLKYIGILENMDKTTMEYASYCFGHAMANGFYTPKVQTPEAKQIYTNLKADTLFKYATKMTYPAPKGFWKNENYTSIDLTPQIKSLLSKDKHIYGLYGKEDGLYSSDQVTDLSKILGKTNVIYYENCSHNVFIDQQTSFIEKLKTWDN